MYIKLTKLDNTPIWLNASFIVTIEPRRGGGSIVVPIGDGLDYEVRETVESVLVALSGAPAPAVVPVPSKDSLTKTPADVSPETELPDLLKEPKPASDVKPVAETSVAQAKPPAAEPAADEAKPAKRTRKTAAKATKTSTTKTATKTRKRTTKKPAAEPAEEAAPESESEEKKPEPPEAPVEPKRTTPLALDAAQLERLKKMTPRSIKKLSNTLIAQFGVGDSFEAIRALEERGIIKTDGSHVLWATEPPVM